MTTTTIKISSKSAFGKYSSRYENCTFPFVPIGAVTVLPFTYMPFLALLSGENDVPDSNIIIFDSSGAANLFTGLLLFTLCETVDFKNGINDVFL